MYYVCFWCYFYFLFKIFLIIIVVFIEIFFNLVTLYSITNFNKEFFLIIKNQLKIVIL